MTNQPQLLSLKSSILRSFFFNIFLQGVIKVWYCCTYFILNACESNVEVDTRLNGYLSNFSGIYDFITIIIGGGPTEKYVPCFQRIRKRFTLNMSNTQNFDLVYNILLSLQWFSWKQCWNLLDNYFKIRC